MDFITNRLILKDITWDDLEEMHQLHARPEVDEFNTVGVPKDMEATKEIIRPMIDAKYKTPRRLYNWKVILKDSNEFIGMAGMTLSRDKFRLGEIYYKLLPEYWGIGFATEIARTLIRCGFEEFNLHKVEAGVATENLASIRVLEKSGMTREGLRRKILPIRGQWKDNYHYAIVEDDPRDY